MTDHDVRVMIVDDQPPFREAASTVVSCMDGFTVVGTAESAEDALATFDDARPDLVLMDVVLPQMSGIEATRLLTGRDDPPVVVLVSTYDAADFGEDVTTCGAAAYFVKSAFGADELRTVWLGQRA